MEAVFILLTVFGSPVAILAVLRHYRLKEKQLQAGIDGQGQQLLLARCEELEARVQTLETIVCEGDLEAAWLRERLLAWVKKNRDESKPNEPAVDKETEDRLKALGYAN